MLPTSPDPSFIERMNGFVHSAQEILFASIDTDIQQRKIDEIAALFPELAEFKARAVEGGDEAAANLALGYECVFSCLASELQMWILLKSREPNKAWDCLILAQNSAVAAARAHPGFRHLPHHLARLEALEQLLFPAQVFVSPGFTVGRQVCSICEEDYDACEHVATRPYWGQFCSIQQEDLALDHVSIVEEPASKLCRFTQIGEGDDCRNRMSGLPEPSSARTWEARLI